MWDLYSWTRLHFLCSLALGLNQIAIRGLLADVVPFKLRWKSQSVLAKVDIPDQAFVCEIGGKPSPLILWHNIITPESMRSTARVGVDACG